MDEIILEVIRNYYSDVVDISTEEFYKNYMNICIDKKVTPKPRQTVTKLVCEYLDIKVQKVEKYYFCLKGE